MTHLKMTCRKERNVKCKVCGESVRDSDHRLYHRECIVDMLYDIVKRSLENHTKPKFTDSQQALASKYKISLVGIKHDVMEDMGIKIKLEEKRTEKAMSMTVDEIKCMYKEAKNKKEQVYILSEMNLCEPWEIVKVLVENGIDSRGFSKSMSHEYHLAKENGMVVPEQQYRRTDPDKVQYKKPEVITKAEAMELASAEPDEDAAETVTVTITDDEPVIEKKMPESYQKTIDMLNENIRKLQEENKELDKKIQHLKVKDFNDAVEDMVSENKISHLEERNKEYIETIQSLKKENRELINNYNESMIINRKLEEQISFLEDEKEGDGLLLQDIIKERDELSKKLDKAEQYILDQLIYK